MAEHICPWWIGYLLASPVRRLWQKPETILQPYVKSGMTVLDVGPGMGYFTLPMARMIGEGGRVVCVDVQERILKSLKRRARRAGLEKRIVARAASPETLGITDFAGQIDFVLAFAVVHEVPSQENLFREIHQAMKPGALLLISEPTGHVTKDSFDQMMAITKRAGFEVLSTPEIKRGINVLLRKKQ